MATTQIHSRRKRKENEMSVVVQVDFAGNFKIQMQNEVKTAHAPLAPSTGNKFYIMFGMDVKYGTGYAFINDKIDHEKVAVFAFINALNLDLLVSFPLESIPAFSDGAVSQFKQKYYLFTNTTGKRAVDGIDGTIKHVVWNNISTGRVVSTAEDIANLLQKITKYKSCIYLTRGDK